MTMGSAAAGSATKLTELIATFEGCRLETYKCSAGHDTIGYGHLIGEDENNLREKRLTNEEALALLERDISTRTSLTAITNSLEPHQSDALTSLCFNIGITNFRGADIVAQVNDGDMTAAVEYFGHWRRAGGSISAGLIKRRLAEACIFADCELDPAGDVPSAQWGFGEMVITDDNWGRVSEDLRTEAVSIFKAYKSDDL